MGSTGTLGLLFPVMVPAGTAAVLYAGHRAIQVNWRLWLTSFLTGPGRTSRILLLIFLITNWKSLPLGWTFRIFHAFIYHFAWPNRNLPQRALFHYSVTASRTSLLETDYNMHKSNSTYFADLDISRSHLVTHMLGSGILKVSDNARTRLVLDRHGNLVKGSFGIGLGAVFCSFRREIAPLQAYELWSRVLAWDRKWLYIVTHFVAKGKVRPTGWDGKRMGPTRSRVVSTGDGRLVDEQDWAKHVYATAVSKYVFKLGRFTIHPAIVIDASHLLPERPGAGWRGGESETGTPDELSNVDEDGEWDWTRVELERRKGMEFAAQFNALDGTNTLFDGGEDGAIGRFPLG